MTIFFSPSLEPIQFRYEEDVKRAAYERKTYFLSWINGGREKKKKKRKSFLLDLKSWQESGNDQMNSEKNFLLFEGKR